MGADPALADDQLGPQKDDVLDLFREFARTQDRAVRDQIVEEHRRVADYYVKRYARRGVPADDLRQLALLTLLRAVERFDPDRGVSFATFASRTIDGEFKRYLRDKTWMVRPPRRAQELHLRLRTVHEQLSHRLGRAPTVPEVAHELDESVDHVLEAMEAGAAYHASSLDQPLSAADDAPTSWADRALATEDPNFGRVERTIVLDELLDQLDEQSRDLLRMRFFENRTQEEIAQIIGVSQSYLSRMLRKVLLDLRAKLGPDVDLTYD